MRPWRSTERGQLSEPMLMLHALAWGLVTAFAMPARDGLVKRVAGARVLRMVVLVVGMQFGMMMLGKGLCGGVTMSMSRTILQERAPASHQSRVMAAHSLAATGGGPLGSLTTGLAVGAVGARWAVLLPILGVLTVTTSVLATHSIWRLRTQRHQVP